MKVMMFDIRYIEVQWKVMYPPLRILTVSPGVQCSL